MNTDKKIGRAIGFSLLLSVFVDLFVSRNRTRKAVSICVYLSSSVVSLLR